MSGQRRNDSQGSSSSSSCQNSCNPNDPHHLKTGPHPPGGLIGDGGPHDGPETAAVLLPEDTNTVRSVAEVDSSAARDDCFIDPEALDELKEAAKKLRRVTYKGTYKYKGMM